MLGFKDSESKSQILALGYVVYLILFSSFDKSFTEIQEFMSNFNKFSFETEMGLKHFKIIWSVTTRIKNYFFVWRY